MNKKMVLSDVQTVFYKIVKAGENEFENKRYLDIQMAKKIARLHKGKVVKVTKRMTETLEFELTK